MKTKKLKPNHGLLALFSILIVLITALTFLRTKGPTGCTTTRVTLPDQSSITADIARTPTQRMTGLSHRDQLDTDKGMLFVFPQADTHGFWMKDTRVPLDILWLRNGIIVDMTTLLPPTGSAIPHYTPKEKADSVVEMSAGQAAIHDLSVGKRLTWDICYASPV